MLDPSIIVLFLLIFLIVIYLSMTESKDYENFDLGVDLRQKPYPGRYHPKFEIGSNFVENSWDCKQRCNALESCRGISYDWKNRFCSLYNDANYLDFNPNFVSWKNFYSKIY